MENIKFIGAANEIQKLYSRYGMVVPVGDLETGKAPAVTPLPATSTQTSITFQFNIASAADIDRISYKVNDSKDAVVVDHPSKGVLTIELDKLEYNSGPYEIELTVENDNGSTVVTTSADLQHYTNWAIASEVLAGNRFIGEDGTEAVGNIPTKDEDDITSTKGHMTVPAGYYAENIVLNVPDPTYGTETFTSNNTYSASTYGYDGFSSVTVAVAPTDGGFVVSSCEWQMDSVVGEEPVVGRIHIDFSAIPDNLPYTLSEYLFGLVVDFTNLYGLVEMEFDGEDNPEGVNIDTIDTQYCSEDVLNAYLQIYEPNTSVPTYVVPCQMTTSYSCSEPEEELI